VFVIDFHIIFRTAVTFFAIYGVYNFIIDVWSYIRSNCDKTNSTGPVIVVKVKNHEECLECVIRNLIFACMKKTHEATVPDILIVDFGSDDSTPVIARNLANDYSFIYYTTSELYERISDTSKDKCN